MGVYTYTAGEKNTAALMNAYAVNSGSVYVNSWTVGSGVTSVTMTNAFPSGYDAFRLIWTGGTMTSSSGDSQLALQVGNGGSWLGTAYYQTLLYVLRASNTTTRAAGIENGTTFAWCGGGFTDSAYLDVSLFNVNRAQKTHLQGPAYLAWGDAGQGTTNGFINNSTAYADAKIIVTGTGTMSNGKIYSYGYRTS